MEEPRYIVQGADQREYGPVEVSVLRQWLQEGRLRATSLVRRAEANQWQALGTLPEMAGVVSPPPLLVAVGGGAGGAGQVGGGKAPLSALAISSLVLGLLTPCTMGLSGFLGFLLGLVALIRMSRHPGRWSGKGLAIGGLCVSALLVALVVPLMLAIAIPNFVKARETSQRNACLNHLRQIDAAKEQWVRENKKRNTDAPAWEDLVGPDKYFKEKPVCPAGGTYTIGDMMTEPTCSVSTHTLQYPLRRREPR